MNGQQIINNNNRILQQNRLRLARGLPPLPLEAVPPAPAPMPVADKLLLVVVATTIIGMVLAALFLTVYLMLYPA